MVIVEEDFALDFEELANRIECVANNKQIKIIMNLNLGLKISCFMVYIF
jgi:hypothetical protein